MADKFTSSVEPFGCLLDDGEHRSRCSSARPSGAQKKRRDLGLERRGAWRDGSERLVVLRQLFRVSVISTRLLQ